MISKTEDFGLVVLFIDLYKKGLLFFLAVLEVEDLDVSSLQIFQTEDLMVTFLCCFGKKEDNSCFCLLL